MDDEISASDFESAASATASPEETVEESPSAGEESDVETEAAPESDETVAEVEDEPVAEAPTPQGPPIPLEVHRKSLENARVKGGEEALAKWRQQYGWAEQIAQPDLQRWGATADRLLTDPVQYWKDLGAELQAHPTYRQQLQQSMQTERQQREASQPPEPDVQIVDADGRVVGMSYSAEAVARREALLEQRLVQRLQADWQQKLAPLDRMRGEAEERERYQQATVKVEQQLAEASKWPHFTDHQQAIGVEVTNGKDLKDAYLTVLQRDIYPSLAANERKAVLGQLRHKVAASTVSPSGGSTRTPNADHNKSFEELFAEKASLFGVG